MGKRGYFVISARTKPEIWERFNQWYGEVHLPLAAKRFGAREAFRLHSREEPNTHVAVYGFDDMDNVQTPAFQSVLQSLILEFDAEWPHGVTRKRMYFDVQDAIAAVDIPEG